MTEQPSVEPTPKGMPAADAGEGVEPGPESASSPATRARFKPAQAPSWPFLIALLLAIVFVLVLVFSASALFVFAVGVALAFFLVPVVSWMERRGLARWIAAILVVVATVLIVVALGLIVVLVAVDQGRQFIENLPAIRAEMYDWYQSLELPAWLVEDIDEAIANLEARMAEIDRAALVTGLVGSAVGFVGGLFAWFLLPFFLFYLLKDQPRMAATFYERVPAPWRSDVHRSLTILVSDFAQYFKAELVVGSIMFVVVTAGTFTIGTVMDAPLLRELALLLGLIAFVMELIPQIGPILSYIPALVLAIPSGIDVVIVVSAFYFIAFNIEGSVLVPNIEGQMISFTGATVLVLIAIGFALGGILGAILALPVASIVRDLFRHFFDKAVEESLVYEPVETSGPGTDR